MSNFLMGVVSRGAGLAMPVTVRPARGPEQIPAAIPTLVEAPSRDLTSEVERDSSAVMVSNTIVQSGVCAAPGSKPAFAAPDTTIARPVGTEAQVAIRPRVESGIAEFVERPETHSALEQATVKSNMIERDSTEATASISPMKDSLRRTDEQADSQEQPAVGTTNETPKPEQRLSPKQDVQVLLQTPVKAESPRSENPGAVAKAATPEKKSINIKIGRVEIRSAQQAPVVQKPRKNSSSGFDDARLSRLYLDRNMR